MKGVRTKAQELVDIVWGRGTYMVSEEDVDKVADHLEQLLPDVFAEEYVEAVVKDLRGQTMTAVDRQLKFHAMQNIKVAGAQFENRPPDFLKMVEYAEGREWSLSDLAEPLFGQRGDMKVYTLDLPLPENGETYTTREVRDIVEALSEIGR